MGSHSLSLIPVTPPTMKACISLIVMVGSICCSPVNFLGVPGPQLGLLGYPGYTGYSGLPYTLYGGQPLIYGGETVSPSIYPFRTALDVLNTLPDYPTLGRVPSFSSLTTLSVQGPYTPHPRWNCTGNPAKVHPNSVQEPQGVSRAPAGVQCEGVPSVAGDKGAVIRHH